MNKNSKELCHLTASHIIACLELRMAIMLIKVHVKAAATNSIQQWNLLLMSTRGKPELLQEGDRLGPSRSAGKSQCI